MRISAISSFATVLKYSTADRLVRRCCICELDVKKTPFLLLMLPIAPVSNTIDATHHRIVTMSATVDAILTVLKDRARPEDREAMSRFAIGSENAFCVRVPVLRAIARDHKKEHELALELFAQPYRETRILATMVADPQQFTVEQAQQWMAEFADWELVDQTCFNLFWKCKWAYEMCFKWSHLPEEFSKRTPFSLMAKLAISDKQRDDADFAAWFPVIERESNDARNFVRKSVNWSLRQIGKRNDALLSQARICAQSLVESGSSSARWIGADALREFNKIELKRNGRSY